MRGSVGLREVEAMAKAYDKTLKADDPRFRRAVKIVDEDGSIVFYEYAFLLSYSQDLDEWIMVFTEHHETHVFDRNSLLWYAQYSTKLPIEAFSQS